MARVFRMAGPPLPALPARAGEPHFEALGGRDPQALTWPLGTLALHPSAPPREQTAGADGCPPVCLGPLAGRRARYVARASLVHHSGMRAGGGLRAGLGIGVDDCRISVSMPNYRVMWKHL